MIVIFISFLIFLVERKEEGMKGSYIVCKIKQHGRELSIVDSNHLGYQFSSNLYIELLMDEDVDNLFKGALLKAICTLDNSNKSYDCTIVNEESKRYILLPSKVFEKVGIVLLSLCAINEDKTIVTTNCLKLYVDESNPIQAEIVPNKEQWEVEVLKVMKEWFHEKVEPLLEKLNLKATDLQNIAEEQQIQVSELMENIQKKLSDGDFNGSSMLHGNGKPSDALGNDNDLYLDVLSTSETVWHIFAKENNVWVDKGGIQSKDGGKVLVGPDLETAQPKTLFIQNITQAQAIAETRGVNVNEYDARLPMNQVRISDEIGSQGLDEYMEQRVPKTPIGTSINVHGIIEQNIDPNLINYTSEIYVERHINLPMQNHGFVKTLCLNNDVAKQWYSPLSDNVVFIRSKVSGVWSNWRLIVGEVLLWSGNAYKINTLIDLNYNYKMFGNMEVYSSGKWRMIGAVTDDFITCSTVYGSGNPTTTLVSSQAIFHVENNTRLSLNADAGHFLTTTANNTGFSQNSILKIYGRP